MTGKQARRRQLLWTIGLRFSGMDVLKALGLYLVAVMCCLLLRSFDMHNDTSYVAMIFLLDVFLTAYWTDGYLLGIIMAVVGMFSVDIIFTYPFWHISFTLTGFPLTFLVMMTISILTATVTSRAKQTEQVKPEAKAPAVLDKVTVDLEAEGDCWLEASADGKTYYKVTDEVKGGRMEARFKTRRKVKALRLTLTREQQNRLTIREFYFR